MRCGSCSSGWVPDAPVRPQGGGRHRYGDRQVLAAIVFVATTGRTWRQLPPDFGSSGPTAHRRFTEWSQPESGPSSTAWSWTSSACAAPWTCRGARSTRCTCGQRKGGLTGPNPVDRGKNGSKIHLITERTGLPISIDVSAANTHDSQGLEPLVRGIPPIRSRRGAPSTTARQGPRRQGLRLRPPAPMAPVPEHHPAHRPQGHRVLPAAGPPPLDRGADSDVAGRVPPPSLAMNAKRNTSWPSLGSPRRSFAPGSRHLSRQA
jgi:transposase